ncbi:MAG: hypothetical protein GY708_14080 [Actinomycetia bacterium]|nr:hypothetical protein [Actinomycetes bacterium]MCP4959789.1 hypothetical protein [Actinomycetes bacterium]
MFAPLPVDRHLRRWIQLVAGLVAFGVGLALVFLADLGLPPWDVLHEGISERLGLPVGSVISLVGAVMVLFMIVLREPLGVGTLLNVLIIGAVVDLVMWAVDDPTSMPVRIGFLIAGPLMVGLAGGLYLGVDMGAGPRDGTMTALGRRGVRIAWARFAIEASAFLGGLALGGTAGFGTVWFLVAIGPATEWSVNRFVLVDADGSNRTVALGES